MQLDRLPNKGALRRGAAATYARPWTRARIRDVLDLAPLEYLQVRALRYARESRRVLWMERHVLTLRYDGLDASYYGGIGTSGSKQVVAGAQMFLGAHAHYYLSGAIPERINDNAPGFVVRDLSRKRGSLIAEFLVVLLGPAIWNAATYSYVAFVRDSYAAVKHGRLFDDPPFDHLQPSLATFDGGNHPLFDLAAAREMQQRRLYQRVRQSRTQISAPIRVTATVVELSMDGYHLDTITHRAHTDEDINEGLRLFREQSASVGRSGYKA
jgi:hypothetical protein